MRSGGCGGVTEDQVRYADTQSPHAPVVDDAVERVAVGAEGDVAPRVHGPRKARQPEAEAHACLPLRTGVLVVLGYYWSAGDADA